MKRSGKSAGAKTLLAHEINGDSGSEEEIEVRKFIYKRYDDGDDDGDDGDDA